MNVGATSWNADARAAPPCSGPAGTNAVGSETFALNGVTLQGQYLADVTAGGASDHVTFQGDVNLSGLTLEIVDPELLDRDKVYTLASITDTRSGSFVPANLPDNRWHLLYKDDGTVKLAFIQGTIMLLR